MIPVRTMIRTAALWRRRIGGSAMLSKATVRAQRAIPSGKCERIYPGIETAVELLLRLRTVKTIKEHVTRPRLSRISITRAVTAMLVKPVNIIML